MTIRDTNLNYRPNNGPKREYKLKTPAIFHWRGTRKIVGSEHQLTECKECKKILPPVAFTTKTIKADGSYYLKKICRQCCTIMHEETVIVKKNAPPKPADGKCACCHIKRERLHCDHLHGSFKFRGWLCKPCNVGLGELGDNLESVLQAAIYLESDTDKIIETLHQVFNKMFARTHV